MFGIGMQEILIILVVALIVIGPKRLPELARTLGKGFAEFRKATDDFQETVRLDLERDKHEEFKKKYPHLLPEDEEEKRADTGQEIGEEEKVSSTPSTPPIAGAPQPSYEPEEIEGGEETENKTRDA
jgi:Tat protein translocase TatB subunit